MRYEENPFVEVEKLADGVWSLLSPGGCPTLCYLVEGAERALLIDTGFGVGDLKALCERLTDKPLLVVDTHSHGDHVLGNPQFDRVYIHALDLEAGRAANEPEQRRRFMDAPEGCGYTIDDSVPDGPCELVPSEAGYVFDLGGGSTELILFKNRQIVESVSLPFGAVNTTDMFNTRGTMSPNVYSDMSFFLLSRLSQHPWLKQNRLPLIGVGGTARTLGKMQQKRSKYPSSKIHNYKFSAQAFHDIFSQLRSTTLEQRRKIAGLSSERADIILAGAGIINCLLETTGCKQMIISGCGLREGLFFDYYSKSENMPLIAPDILDRSTQNILTLYTPDTTHSKHITELALTMFDAWKDLHKLDKDYRKLLKTAALLHDIGITINFYSHARHSAYMIQNAQIFGLSHREQLITSAIAGWHNGISKNYFRDRNYKELLNENHWQAINKLALLLALAESLDYSQTNQIRGIQPRIEKKHAVLTLHAEGIPSIEMHQIKQHIRWFAKVFGVELSVQLG